MQDSTAEATKTSRDPRDEIVTIAAELRMISAVLDAQMTRAALPDAVLDVMRVAESAADRLQAAFHELEEWRKP